jgi:hypothetical protein
MSKENVDLVIGTIPPPEVDLALLARDDEQWAQLDAAIGPRFDPDFECATSLVGKDTVYRGGLQAFRSFWLDWLAPYSTFRLEEIERAIDCGDQVVVVVRHAAGLKDSEYEIRGRNASIWTLRQRQAVRWEGFPDRAQALKALGLEE